MDFYRPNFLTVTDYPWLTKLVGVYEALEGESVKSVDDRMTDDDVPPACRTKFSRAKRYLNSVMAAPSNVTSSREIRLAYFTAIFEFSTPPGHEQDSAICRSLAGALGLDHPKQVHELLLADIDEEQLIRRPAEMMDTATLCNEINLAFAKSLLRRAEHLEIKLTGQCRRVMQLAKLKGLICITDRQSEDYLMHLSGPLSLNCKTKIYAHAFASLASVLPWCDRYELTARCDHGEKAYNLRLQTGDPIKPSKNPKLCDSKIEEQVSKSMLRHFPDWQAIREPRPLETSAGILFPDFLIQNKHAPSQRFFCEIVGWWTDEYLKKKLHQWSLITDVPFVLCISKTLCAEIPKGFDDKNVMLFKSRIDVKELMRIGLAKITLSDGAKSSVTNLNQ